MKNHPDESLECIREIEIFQSISIELRLHRDDDRIHSCDITRIWCCMNSIVRFSVCCMGRGYMRRICICHSGLSHRKPTVLAVSGD